MAEPVKTGSGRLDVLIEYDDGEKVTLTHLMRPVALMELEQRNPQALAQARETGLFGIGELMVLAWVVAGRPGVFDEWVARIVAFEAVGDPTVAASTARNGSRKAVGQRA